MAEQSSACYARGFHKEETAELRALVTDSGNRQHPTPQGTGRMNRRIRNRTYGGVGGRPGERTLLASYPIVFPPSCHREQNCRKQKRYVLDCTCNLDCRDQTATMRQFRAMTTESAEKLAVQGMPSLSPRRRTLSMSVSAAMPVPSSSRSLTLASRTPSLMKSMVPE